MECGDRSLAILGRAVESYNQTSGQISLVFRETIASQFRETEDEDEIGNQTMKHSRRCK